MKKRFLSIGLAAISALSLAFSACSIGNGGKNQTEKKAPDYSFSTLQYEFYGYSSLIDGWNIDGEAFDVEEDYLSVKRIK